MNASARRGLWGAVAVLLAASALLVQQWPGRGFWYDETVNAYFARQSWSAIWEWCTRIDNQVPLHFVLLKLWGSLAGTGEFALRAFSAGCALLAAASVYALGRRVGGSLAAGVLAALAFVLSQSFEYAAFEVRPYALSLALFAWSSLVLWTLWERYAVREAPLDRRAAELLGAYWLLALALIYTHYTGFVALAAHAVYVGGHTMRRPSRQRARLLAALAAGLVIGYLPWVIALAGRDVRAGTAYEGRVEPLHALDRYVEFYAYGQRTVPGNEPPYAQAILAVFLLALAGLVWQRRDRLRASLFALALAAVPLLGLLLMVYGVQAKLSGRHGWPAWIGMALLLGIGLAPLNRLRVLHWPLWGAALLLIWLPASAHFQPVYNSYFREAAAYLNQHAEPGDALVLRDGTLFTAAGYYSVQVPWTGLPPDRLTDVRRFLFVDEAADRLADLVEREQARRVWVLEWQGQIMDPQNLVAGMLEASGEAVPLPDAFGFGDVSLTLYRLDQSPRRLAGQVSALLPLAQVPPDGPIFCGGTVLERDPVPHGGMVRVQTWWKRGASVMPGMRISARLYDLNGVFYSQLDQPPAGPSFGQENWPADVPVLGRLALEVPPDMPAGIAEVRLILYDLEGTFEPVSVLVDRFTVAE